MTIRPWFNPTRLKLYRLIRDIRVRYVLESWVVPPHDWLRPDGRNPNRMIRLVNRNFEESAPVLEFMLHYSELMPGGSPFLVLKPTSKNEITTFLPCLDTSTLQEQLA